MTPIQRHYNKMMDKAIAKLETNLQKKLGFVSSEAMQEAVRVQHVAPANRLGQKHMELDLIHTVYLLNNEPFVQYRFFAIATKFDYAVSEVKRGKETSTRTGSDTPLLYGADGDIISVVGDSGGEKDKD